MGHTKEKPSAGTGVSKELDMMNHEEILERVLAKVSDKVAESMKETVVETVRRELSSSMSKAMVESEFYKRVSEEMHSGLKSIYQIANASTREDTEFFRRADSGETQKLFTDAAQQVEEIMQATFQATENILEKIERLLDRQRETDGLIDKLKKGTCGEEDIGKIAAYNGALAIELTEIITELSFQDLTGQRLKKVVDAIGRIRETVFDLYVSTGLMMKGKEERPEADVDVIAEESRRKVAQIKNFELKGPVSGSSQKDVDDLLANLGL